jgi:NCS1 family nucleobase:cation symporter-1
MMPWKLLSNFNSYIFSWLPGYSGLLGPIAGIMIADYFVVRKRFLTVDALYRRGGIYEYRQGVIYRVMFALVSGIVVALVGLVIPSLRWLYDHAWFTGFFSSAGVYCILMRSVPLLEKQTILP